MTLAILFAPMILGIVLGFFIKKPKVYQGTFLILLGVLSVLVYIETQELVNVLFMLILAALTEIAHFVLIVVFSDKVSTRDHMLGLPFLGLFPIIPDWTLMEDMKRFGIMVLIFIGILYLKMIVIQVGRRRRKKYRL